jgi:excisionase family DNA binding protein
MILKTTQASKYIGVSINTIKTLANNGKIKSFKTTGEHRRFRVDANEKLVRELKDAKD